MQGKKKNARKVRENLSISVSGQPLVVPKKPRVGPVRHVSFKKKKQFASSHREGVNLASPASTMMRPLSMRSIKTRSSTRCVGTDFLTAITIGASNAAAGDVLYTTVVNPSTLGLGRLATVAKLYERYKFRSLKFRYAPVANAQISGQLLGYVDYDTMDDPTGSTGIQNLQRAGAHLGEKPVQVWQGSEKPVFWEIKDQDPLTDLYCDSDGTDPRWTNQGRFVLLAASAIAANTPCGNIYLDYDIEFFIPQLEVTPTFGYGAKQTGGGTLSAASIFGSVRSLESWNNLPGFSCSATVMSLPAGSYLITGALTGTVLAALNVASTGTIVRNDLMVSSTALYAQYAIHVTATSPFTVTPSCTATTVTASMWMVSLLPSNAISISQRKIAAVNRLLKQVEALRLTNTIEESKESKETKCQEIRYQSEMLEPVYLKDYVQVTNPPNTPVQNSSSSLSSGTVSSVMRFRS